MFALQAHCLAAEVAPCRTRAHRKCGPKPHRLLAACQPPAWHSSRSSQVVTDAEDHAEGSGGLLQGWPDLEGGVHVVVQPTRLAALMQPPGLQAPRSALTSPCPTAALSPALHQSHPATPHPTTPSPSTTPSNGYNGQRSADGYGSGQGGGGGYTAAAAPLISSSHNGHPPPQRHASTAAEASAEARALTRRINACSSWQELRALMSLQSSAALNEVHITAATHKTASLTSRYTLSASERQQLGEWLDRSLLPLVLHLQQHMGPRELTTVLHSLAVLHHVPHVAWLETYSSRTAHQLDRFSMRDCSSCVWSLARLLDPRDDPHLTSAHAPPYLTHLTSAHAPPSSGTQAEGGALPSGSWQAGRYGAGGGAQEAGRRRWGGGGGVPAAAAQVAGGLLQRSLQLLDAANEQDIANLALGAASLCRFGLQLPDPQPSPYAEQLSAGRNGHPLSAAPAAATVKPAAVRLYASGNGNGGRGAQAILDGQATLEGADNTNPGADTKVRRWQDWRGQFLQRLQPLLAGCGPQALANVAHGLARLPAVGPVPEAWRDMFQRTASRLLPASSPQALAALLGALGPLGYPLDGPWATQLLAALETALPQCNLDDLCDLGLHTPQLLRARTARGSETDSETGSETDQESREAVAQWWWAYEEAVSYRLGSSAQPRQMALLLVSLARGRSLLGLSPSRTTLAQWFSFATPLLPRFPPLEVAQSLAACTVLGIVPSQGFMEQALAAVRRGMRSAPLGHTANALWWCAGLRYRPSWRFMLDLYSHTSHSHSHSGHSHSHGTTGVSDVLLGGGEAWGSLSAVDRARHGSPGGSMGRRRGGGGGGEQQLGLRDAAQLLGGLARLQQHPLSSWVDWLLGALPAAVEQAVSALRPIQGGAPAADVQGSASAGHLTSSDGSRQRRWQRQAGEAAAGLVTVMWALYRLHIVPGAGLAARLVAAAAAAAPHLPAGKALLLVWAVARVVRSVAGTGAEAGVRSAGRRGRLVGARGPLLPRLRPHYPARTSRHGAPVPADTGDSGPQSAADISGSPQSLSDSSGSSLWDATLPVLPTSAGTQHSASTVLASAPLAALAAVPAAGELSLTPLHAHAPLATPLEPAAIPATHLLADTQVADVATLPPNLAALAAAATLPPNLAALAAAATLPPSLAAQLPAVATISQNGTHPRPEWHQPPIPALHGEMGSLAQAAGDGVAVPTGVKPGTPEGMPAGAPQGDESGHVQGVPGPVRARRPPYLRLSPGTQLACRSRWVAYRSMRLTVALKAARLSSSPAHAETSLRDVIQTSASHSNDSTGELMAGVAELLLAVLRQTTPQLAQLDSRNLDMGLVAVSHAACMVPEGSSSSPVLQAAVRDWLCAWLAARTGQLQAAAAAAGGSGPQQQTATPAATAVQLPADNPGGDRLGKQRRVSKAPQPAQPPVAKQAWSPTLLSSLAPLVALALPGDALPDQTLHTLGVRSSPTQPAGSHGHRQLVGLLAGWLKQVYGVPAPGVRADGAIARRQRARDRDAVVVGAAQLPALVRLAGACVRSGAVVRVVVRSLACVRQAVAVQQQRQAVAEQQQRQAEQQQQLAAAAAQHSMTQQQQQQVQQEVVADAVPAAAAAARPRAPVATPVDEERALAVLRQAGDIRPATLLQAAAAVLQLRADLLQQEERRAREAPAASQGAAPRPGRLLSKVNLSLEALDTHAGWLSDVLVELCEGDRLMLHHQVRARLLAALLKEPAAQASAQGSEAAQASGAAHASGAAQASSAQASA